MLLIRKADGVRGITPLRQKSRKQSLRLRFALLLANGVPGGFRGFPPIRRKKGEWMGHGEFVVLMDFSFLDVTRRGGWAAQDDGRDGVPRAMPASATT